MRSILTTIGAIIAISATVSIGATEIDAGRLFKDLDANTDGKVSRDEVGDEHRLLFGRLVRTGDDDRDGGLSAQEFEAALQPVRAEKSTVEKQGSRLPGADALVVMLARMDADGNSRLNAEEIPEKYQDVFERMLGPGDENKDGKLDAREIARGGPRLGIIAQLAAARLGIDVQEEAAKLPADRRASLEEMDAYPRPETMMADPEQADEMFKRLDANGDKQLSMDEAPAPFAERFQEMLRRGDSDGDEQLSKREFLEIGRRIAAMQTAEADPEAARRIVRQMLARFDRNDDGKLTQKEAPPRLAEAFNRADVDGDDALDRTELTAVAENMGRMRPMGRDQRSVTESKQDSNPAKERRKGKPSKKSGNN